jgi:hypothetical protein
MSMSRERCQDCDVGRLTRGFLFTPRDECHIGAHPRAGAIAVGGKFGLAGNPGPDLH